MRKVLFIMGQLHDEDIAWMAEAGRRQMLRPGEVIVRQGVEVPDLFIVLTGAVEVEVAGLGVMARRPSGEIIGEMSFVDRAPPSATVRAGEPTVVLALDKGQMERRLATNTGFAARFYKALAIYLADRLREEIARGNKAAGRKSGQFEEDELDEAVLDNVSMAGLRFQDMLRTLMGSQVG
jgi:CRP-like cAMP-binding protein